MIKSYAAIRSPLAMEFLLGLSRYWLGSLPDADGLPTHSELQFPAGRCILDAWGDMLDVTIVADSNRDATLLEDLIADHIGRLSYGEELRYCWIRPSRARKTARKLRQRPSVGLH